MQPYLACHGATDRERVAGTAMGAGSEVPQVRPDRTRPRRDRRGQWAQSTRNDRPDQHARRYGLVAKGGGPQGPTDGLQAVVAGRPVATIGAASRTRSQAT